MNPFIFSFIALCITQGAVGQYQNGASYGNAMGYQRKMAPMPQTYGASQSASGYQAAPAANYQQQQQQSYEMSGPSYEQPQQQQAYAQRAPSSASVSTYDERTPAASSSYGKSATGYSQKSSGYSAPAAYQQQPQQQQYQPQQSYAKAAPKYEEPNHPPMPFAWGYDINDGYGGAQYHKESGDEYGKRTGSYGYTDAYGVYRQVDYVADEHGFRATIKTNEPGTANESPADVELHAYEPPSNYYAGNTHSYGSSNSYGKQQAAAPAYSRPTTGYSAPAAAARSYAKPMSTSGYQSRGSNYEQQYAGSAMVPVYQKAAVSAGKKY